MRWRLPGHAGPLIPVWTVGTLLLWEVTERSELPSGPGRRALAGLSAIGTQDPECTASPPPSCPTSPFLPPPHAPLPHSSPPPLLPPGCTSAMHSLPESQLKQAGAPYRPPPFMDSVEPFQGHWAGSSPLPSTSHKQVEPCRVHCQVAGKRWDPGGRDPRLWAAEGRVTAC